MYSNCLRICTQNKKRTHFDPADLKNVLTLREENSSLLAGFCIVVSNHTDVIFFENFRKSWVSGKTNYAPIRDTRRCVAFCEFGPNSQDFRKKKSKVVSCGP